MTIYSNQMPGHKDGGLHLQTSSFPWRLSGITQRWGPSRRRKDQRNREPPRPHTSLTQGMEPQQAWREAPTRWAQEHPGNPRHHGPHGRHKHQQPSAGGQDNAASREPHTQSRPVPTSQADPPHPLPGQRSPTSSPSAALRAPLPFLAFCLRNSTCLHLPSPLTPQLRETTRPCLGPPSCAAA